MPIPGSSLELVFDMDAASELMADVGYPSVATYYAMSKSQDGAGQEQHTFAALADPEYSNIICRRTPQILIRPQDQEIGTAQLPSSSSARYHLSLPKYLPLISLDGQMEVDGVRYEIKAIDCDGSKFTTRLELGKEIPFNA